MNKTRWELDPMHSEVQFRAKHLMITTVTGYFKKFELSVETEDDDFIKATKIEFSADVNSIDTNNAQRDTHLKSDDFFNADKYAEISFVGNRFKKHEDHYDLYGDLTIRDITKPIKVKVEFAGIAVDPYGQTKAGFHVDGKISRKEFGLMWNAITEAGQIVVSDEIKFHCEIQLIKQQAEEHEQEEREEQAVA